ncbi:MAG TPA: SHOCT domain-containing protein [Jatrophihabitans sp.]|nr:SHOCT domain-containing protein [Jatrophihabitans sp.]
MIVADASYPLGSVLLTMTVFFGWLLWIWLLVMVYIDLFRRDDMRGWAKAGWVIFTIVLPFVGVFVYLIAEGRQMVDRQADRAMSQQSSFDNRVRRTAGHSHRDGGAEIAKARDLLDRGAVTDEEYEVMRQNAIRR